MNLRRTPLLLSEAQPVPVDWPTKVGYPPPGVIRKRAYPAGNAKGTPGIDVGVDEYPDTPEGRKLAQSHAWQFLKPVKVGKKTLRY